MTSSVELGSLYRSFLVSASTRDVDEVSGVSSADDISGERTLLPFMFGEPATVERSSSLWGPNVGLEWEDRDAVASASSLRRASSSRSNLEDPLVKLEDQGIENENVLATEDFDVEPSAIPNTHREDEQKESATPER